MGQMVTRKESDVIVLEMILEATRSGDAIDLGSPVERLRLQIGKAGECNDQPCQMRRRDQEMYLIGPVQQTNDAKRSPSQLSFIFSGQICPICFYS